ncbi:MAG: peptidylprolyl isomerase [Anaerolinea sp.]|nr:peptidylprolyl isomerase [Anaerolinea sp.]
MLRILKRLLLALTVTATLSACGGAAPADSVTTSPATQPPAVLPTNAAGEQIVARVNAQEITLPQLQRMEAQLGGSTTEIRALALQTLIEQTVIRQAAAAQNIAITDAELDAELQAYIERAGGADAWQTWLTSNNYSEADFRETLRDNLITQRMRDSLTADLNADVPQVHARHILVGTEQEALDVLARLQNGDDFAALAAVLSRDVTTRTSGGDLGWFAADELLEPLLAEQAFDLQPGEIVGPVATSLGFHIIQVIERGDRPLTEDRRAFVAQVRFENWLSQLLATAAIEHYL